MGGTGGSGGSGGKGGNAAAKRRRALETPAQRAARLEDLRQKGGGQGGNAAKKRRLDSETPAQSAVRCQELADSVMLGSPKFAQVVWRSTG